MDETVHRREFLHLSAAGGLAAAVTSTRTVLGQPAPEDAVVGSGSLLEPARSIPIRGDYDVLVVGGGIAGVAAAVSAARFGASVCLIDKESALGGLATLANVVIYLPICDGRGNQVIRGLGEELLKLSIGDGFNPIPACWQPGGDMAQRQKTRYRVTFNPASYMLALEKWLIDAGVHLLYDTRFCAVLREENRIKAAVVENKSGRSAIVAKTFVDASGDADVCALAGEPTVSLKTNVAAGWFYSTDRRSLRLEVNSAEYGRDPRTPPKHGRGFAGDDAEDVTAQILASRQMIRNRIEKSRRAKPDKPAFAAILPTIASFRMTRRLEGRTVLTEAHDHDWFDDAVGMTGDWRKPGPVYFLPLSCMTGVANANLVAAGRCISAGGRAWDITRVIPTCAVTGEGAGAAAAVAAASHGGDLSRIDISGLQTRLVDQGVFIDRRVAR